MFVSHDTTPDDEYTIGDARARFQELTERSGNDYSTPAELQEIAELTAYIADWAAFGFGSECDEWAVGA